MLEILSILILFALLTMVVYRFTLSQEGFADLQGSYSNLQTKIQGKLADYIKLSEYAQKQLKTMYMSSSNVSGDEAETRLQQTYRDIYACKDDLAESRPSCKPVSAEFTPLSTYKNLPNWSESDDTPLVVALMSISDSLPEKIQAELAYYKALVEKLQTTINSAKNPPSAPPGAAIPSLPEGFQGATCSPAALQAKKEKQRREQLEKSSEGCTAPSLDSEIARVSALLDSGRLSSSLSSCNNVLGQMIQVEKDIEEVKRKWGDGGPTRSYKTFQGGDRSKSLVFSMQQV